MKFEFFFTIFFIFIDIKFIHPISLLYRIIGLKAMVKLVKKPIQIYHLAVPVHLGVSPFLYTYLFLKLKNIKNIYIFLH